MRRVGQLIGCKIRGLKPPSTTQSTTEEGVLEEGLKIVKVVGCEYRISEEEIVAWLSLFSEVVSEVEEDFYIMEENNEEEKKKHNLNLHMVLYYFIKNIHDEYYDKPDRDFDEIFQSKT